MQEAILIAWTNVTLTGVGTVSLPTTPTPAWGTTPATVATQFAYNIWLNFGTNANLNAMFTGMDPFMLARLSTELKAHDTGGYTAQILRFAGETLSAANLVRLTAAFGVADGELAVSYATAATRAAYYATAALPAYPLSVYWLSLGHTYSENNTQMWLYDIFLDSYTAGGGGPTNTALQATSRYAMRVVSDKGLVEVGIVVGIVAAVVGTVVGVTQIYENATGTTNSLQQLSDFIANNSAIFLNDNRAIYYTGGVTLQAIPVPNPDLPTLPPVSGDDPNDGNLYDLCSDGLDLCSPD